MALYRFRIIPTIIFIFEAWALDPKFLRLLNPREAACAEWHSVAASLNGLCEGGRYKTQAHKAQQSHKEPEKGEGQSA